MQPAFLAGVVLLPPPAAGARMLAGLHGARARLATQRRIAAIVQRVVRHVLLADVLPDLVERPVHERAEFPDAVGRVERALGHVAARAGLLAAQARDPALLAGERAAQRFDLADVAARLARIHAVVETIHAEIFDVGV